MCQTNTSCAREGAELNSLMQWALGIMMYQMLSGHLPFWNAQSDRSPFAVMSAILNAEVSHPCFGAAFAPSCLRTLILNTSREEALAVGYDIHSNVVSLQPEHG